MQCVRTSKHRMLWWRNTYHPPQWQFNRCYKGQYVWYFASGMHWLQSLHHWILITATSATLDRFGNDCCKRLQICSRSSGLLSFLLRLFTHLPSEVKFRNHVLSINGDRRLLCKSRRVICAFIVIAKRKNLLESTPRRIISEIYIILQQ